MVERTYAQDEHNIVVEAVEESDRR